MCANMSIMINNPDKGQDIVKLCIYYNLINMIPVLLLLLTRLSAFRLDVFHPVVPAWADLYVIVICRLLRVSEACFLSAV